MILKLIVDDQLYELNIPEDFVAQAESFFAKMDQDMDAGWQIGREWVEKPGVLQRAQIAANKLFSAMENDNHDLGRLMAGYIVSRVPDVDAVEVTAATEIGDIVIRRREQSAQIPSPSPAAIDPTFYPAGHEPSSAPSGMPGGLNKMEAMAQAGKDVSQVFRSGKQWKFSMYNHATGQWEESPAIADKAEAEKLRDFAFKKRFDELCG
jgi:hypothetical protein